jgi:hypothetical protein
MVLTMALVAVMPSSILCRTLCSELPEDIFSQKKKKKKIPQPIRILLVSQKKKEKKEIGIITTVKWTSQKLNTQ